MDALPRAIGNNRTRGRLGNNGCRSSYINAQSYCRKRARSSGEMSPLIEDSDENRTDLQDKVSGKYDLDFPLEVLSLMCPSRCADSPAFTQDGEATSISGPPCVPDPSNEIAPGAFYPPKKSPLTGKSVNNGRKSKQQMARKPAENTLSTRSSAGTQQRTFADNVNEHAHNSIGRLTGYTRSNSTARRPTKLLTSMSSEEQSVIGTS